MKLALGIVAICALFLVAATTPVMAQGAFSDVPSDHWAYDAVQELAADGLIIGYPDGLYKGNRAMTRYEFAMAISRIKEKGGMVGPVGPAGAQGEPGPAGAGDGAALTERQAQLLQQLQDEFMPELSQIRSDLDDVTMRVDDLEAMMGTGPKTPKIKVDGDIVYRTGFYGTDLKPIGGDTNPYPGVIGLAKDAYKASNFGTMVTTINLAGQINDDVMVNVTLLAEPRTNFPDEVSDPTWNLSLGLMDVVRVDEAWAKVNSRFIVPLTAKVGKQYFKANQGLALDNGLFALKAIDVGVGAGGNMMLHGIYGQFDREAFGGVMVTPPSSVSNEGQDIFGASTLTIPVGGWTVTGVYVHSGINSQRVWSVGAEGKLLNRAITAEFAQALRDSANRDINSEDKAWVLGANLLDTTNLTLGAKYGQLDYNFIDGANLSALVPYAAVSPHDIDWVDRPLFLDHNNIARGWEVNLAYRGLANGTMPIMVRYYDGDQLVSPGVYGNGDAVWTVSVSKQLAQDVMATLLYGRREVENTVVAPGADPIQVVRGELAVKF
ncbi:MAG TPA: S-layer homology domain-containing protein [Armatimonadota bacterium]|nr:S-layer homology domain-containing protein [Armatimonadota bacterium]